jgi:hypothetical protein
MKIKPNKVALLRAWTYEKLILPWAGKLRDAYREREEYYRYERRWLGIDNICTILTPSFKIGRHVYDTEIGLPSGLVIPLPNGKEEVCSFDSEIYNEVFNYKKDYNSFYKCINTLYKKNEASI